jgi:hypothetical protein
MFECREKRKFFSRQEAKETIQYLQDMSYGGVEPLKTYRCKKCKKWHLARREK